MRGLANLSPGEGSNGLVTAKFLGMVGRDQTGKEYRQKLEQQGVKPLLLEALSDAPSACSLCLVTPDGQRTMRTCLGASLELKATSQVSEVGCTRISLRKFSVW